MLRWAVLAGSELSPAVHGRRSVSSAGDLGRRQKVRSSSKKKLRLRSKGGKAISDPRCPSPKSVEVVVKLKAYRDQDAIIGPNPKPGVEINGQLSNDHQDAVVAVAEMLNQFSYGFTEGNVPLYAEAFSEALHDLMAKHWPEGL